MKGQFQEVTLSIKDNMTNTVYTIHKRIFLNIYFKCLMKTKRDPFPTTAFVTLVGTPY